MIKSRQKGLTLLELILVASLVALGTMLAFESKQIEMEQFQARTTGGLLFQYNNAVRSWISANPTTAAGTHTGSSWLKPTSCGGSSTIEYLPCTFPDATTASPITAGKISLQSVTEISGVTPNKRVTITTTTTPYLNRANAVRSDLAGLATIVAAAGTTAAALPTQMATDGRYKSSPTTGAITMVASNNADNDIWLRTDGGNTMNNNLTFNPNNAANLREIHNVSRLYGLAADVFYIGQSGGALANQTVVIDANQQVLGNLTVSNTASQPNALTLAKGNLVLQSGDLTVNGKATITQSLATGGAITSSSSITGNGTVASNSAMMSPVYYDSDNTAYKVDPSANSFLQDLQVNNTVSTGGRLTVGEYVQLNGVAAEGTACASNGLVARNASGATLSCQNGVWTASAAFGAFSYFEDHCYICERTTNLGTHKMCTLQRWAGPGGTNNECNVYNSGTSWFMYIRDYNQSDQSQQCGVMCVD